MAKRALELLLASSLVAGCGATDANPDTPPSSDGSGESGPGEEAPNDEDASEGVTEREEPSATDLLSAVSRGGTYTLQWRPRGGEIPNNEHFEIEVWLYRGPDENGNLVPLSGAGLAISGWMPAHGHGMIRRPQAADRGEGGYLVKGMLFHMRGHWQLFFDIVEDGLSERVEFELDL